MLMAAEKEDWELWGRTFHAFWFKGSSPLGGFLQLSFLPGRWEDMEPGVRARLVQSTTPHTVHEIRAVVQALHRGEQYAQVTGIVRDWRRLFLMVMAQDAVFAPS